MRDDQFYRLCEEIIELLRDISEKLDALAVKHVMLSVAQDTEDS